MSWLDSTNTGDIHMKDNRIILDTHKLLGFRLVDTKQLLGVASGDIVSTKEGIIKVKVGAKIGGKEGQKNSKDNLTLSTQHDQGKHKSPFPWSSLK